MSSFSRFFLRDPQTPNDRVRLRCETTTPPSPDSTASAGDVCIVKNGASSTVLQYDGSAWNSIAGGGDALGYFSALAKPETPHANDNEFDSSDELAAFTTWRPDTSTGTYVQSVANSNLTVSLAAQDVRFCGPHRSTPSATADFSVWTKISFGVFDIANGDQQTFGLMLGDNDLITSPSTAQSVMFVAEQFGTTNTGVRLFIWKANYNATAVSLYYQQTQATLSPFVQSLFMRIRWRASPAKMFFDVSLDGVAWTQIRIGTDVPLTPTRAGIFVYNTFGGNTLGRAEFLRFSNSAAFDQYALGRVV